MTEDSIRDPLALAMFAAWVNCDPAAIPDKFKGHTCPATMAAWKRVGVAALAFFERDRDSDRSGEAVETTGSTGGESAGRQASPVSSSALSDTEGR